MLLKLEFSTTDDATDAAVEAAATPNDTAATFAAIAVVALTPPAIIPPAVAKAGAAVPQVATVTATAVTVAAIIFALRVKETKGADLDEIE